MGEPKRTRLVFLGFPDEGAAWDALDVIEGAQGAKEIAIEDWALVTKAPGGKATIHNDRKKDPGAMRGAAVGGAAGMALAVIAGPVGAAAVVTGAAIGAIAAGLKDSGMKTGDIETVSRYMEEGRSGLMIAIPLEEAGRWDAFLAANEEAFEEADRRHQVDIVPGHSFEAALKEYGRNEED